MKPAILPLLSCGLVGLVACTPDPAPSATIESATPDQLMPADDTRDDLTIKLRYEDGDGDLGGGVADVYDCRASDVVVELAIPEIAADPGQHITGTLELHVNDVGAIVPGALPAACTDLGIRELASDTAVFCVVLVDAAGHGGDGDCTRPITLAGKETALHPVSLPRSPRETLGYPDWLAAARLAGAAAGFGLQLPYAPARPGGPPRRRGL